MPTFRSSRLAHGGLLAFVAAAASARPAVADEADILRELRAFFQTDRPGARREIAERIAADPAYDRGRVRAWLHAAGLFAPRRSGRDALRVPIVENYERTVALRVPRDYDPARPWPLIYALHGSGGGGASILDTVERLLGERVEEFVVAAPDNYDEWIVHGKWPPTGEHATVLRSVKEHVHVDGDRVYALGYSRGGHAAWTLAVVHPDLFAGVAAIAGTLLLPEIDGLWPEFVPNASNTHVLAVWGAGDIYDHEGKPSPQGGIAQLNRALRRLAEASRLPIVAIELPEADHADVVPPASELATLLERRRRCYPAAIRHRFRDLSQGRVYWLEPLTWSGAQWGNGPMKIEFRQGEDTFDPAVVRAATLRTYRMRLGELEAAVEGQEIRVTRRLVSEMIVWVGDGMIDWGRPVVLRLSGRKDFEGVLQPDLLLCLTEAARTRDFDRLRWSGLYFKSGARTRPVVADDIRLRAR